MEVMCEDEELLTRRESGLHERHQLVLGESGCDDSAISLGAQDATALLDEFGTERDRARKRRDYRDVREFAPAADMCSFSVPDMKFGGHGIDFRGSA